ncbi:hypothetical protein B0J17DRAFT_188440 [Rhizoctonia solani]|nr:hypothetical protein B0J17DRAFT_188440 [Rhizoctonia solani]
MKLERENLTTNIGELHAQIGQLEATVIEQKRRIEDQQAQIERLNQAKARWLDTYAICLVDGDGYIFDKKLLVNGYDGGREAAASLTRQLHQDLGNTSTSLWTCVYYNHSGLKKVLSKAQIVSESTFDEFCDGFRSASQLIHMMDVGRRKEAADEKIKEMLRVFVAAPQTKVVYFGGGHDSGYAGTLSRYQNLGLEDKIVILKGYDDIAYDLRKFPFRIMSTDGLFMPEKVDLDPQTDVLPQPNPQPMGRSAGWNRTTPPAVTSYASAATLTVPPLATKNRSPSPSHARRASRDTGRGGQRRIDTSKPLHKQIPSICNYHVLSIRGCRNGPDCPHAHDYVLTEDQKNNLRDYMLTVPCDHGEQCINEACILGHRCPSGRGCMRFQKNMCRFKDALEDRSGLRRLFMCNSCLLCILSLPTTTWWPMEKESYHDFLCNSGLRLLSLLCSSSLASTSQPYGGGRLLSRMYKHTIKPLIVICIYQSR